MRAVREPLGLDPTPAAALLALRDDPHPVALVGSWAAGTAVVASAPVRVAEGAGAAWAELGETGAADAAGGAAASGAAAASGTAAEFGGLAVGAAWIGTLAFGLGASVERLPPPPPRPSPGPDAWLGFYDHLLVRDGDGAWWCEALVPDAAREAAVHERFAELRRRLAASLGSTAHGAADPRLVDARVRTPGYAGHAAAVAAGVEAIAAGEVFQANLCLRVDARLEGAAIDLFARASAATSPAFGAYVDTGDRQLVSLSPERFLRREGAAVVSSPIKGTAPRDAAPADLAGSAKDRAEHVMILDLVRNDLGRVCAYGSVTADAEPRLEAHPGVWHLVSDVRGTLREGVTDADLVRAAFPPGSVTGAPKVQALRVIARLEATGREAYTGAIGLVSPVAGLELNVAIRTFEVAGGRVWLGAGGGVVADSDPAAETVEAWRKAAPLVAAAGGELAPPPAGAGGHAAPPATDGSRLPVAAATRSRLALPGGWEVPLATAPRPDPSLGVFETVGVHDGVPVRLDAHLARLAASVCAVHGARLDLAAARAAVRDASPAADARRGSGGDVASGASFPPVARLRVRWTPPGDLTAELTAETPSTAPVPLVPLLLPGGLGAHKWSDRRLVDAAEGTPLLVDLDGDVLEAGWATVWALEGDRLRTPPADGRLLPGVTRAAVLHAGLGEETPLTLDRLAAADAVLLTSAVSLAREGTLPGRGARPAPRPALDRLHALLRG